MLPKSFRADLRANRDFFQQAFRVVTPVGQVYWLPNPDQVSLAVLVSKRVSPLAVMRHQVKRRWRSQVTTLAKAGSIPAGTWVWVVKPSAATVKGSSLQAAIVASVRLVQDRYEKRGSLRN